MRRNRLISCTWKTAYAAYAPQILLRRHKNIKSVIEKERQLSPIASEAGRKLLKEKTIRRMKEQNENIRTVILTIVEELNRLGFEKGFLMPETHSKGTGFGRESSDTIR